MLRNVCIIFALVSIGCICLPAQSIAQTQPGPTVPPTYDSHMYTLGLRVGLSTLTGGYSPKTPFQLEYGFHAGHRMGRQWWLEVDLWRQSFTNDSTRMSSFGFGFGDDNATLRISGYSIGVTLNRLLFDERFPLNMSVGVGAGMFLWQGKDPVGDTLVRVTGANLENRDYRASELFVRLKTGIRGRLTDRMLISWELYGDYLTGAGAEFADDVNAARDRIVVGTGFTLRFGFGAPPPPPQTWRSESSWSQSTLPLAGTRPEQRLLDSDSDGIPDKRDRCLDTPIGVVVDKFGCPLDSDGDGVPDGYDDCPMTDPMARGEVDIFGCAVDSDFDGIPDYRDRCPRNEPGARVDDEGCPLDGDNDGVPDGLDDCPFTMYGVDVDRRGCIDLSLFDQPLVLNIDYVPGSFEIDPTNRERIKKLARLLLFVTDIKLEISGYTDNIGKPDANRALSLKRANRVRDFLVAQGVTIERINVYGRGESNFVASNDTAAGRAKNRRVEIVFVK